MHQLRQLLFPKRIQGSLVSPFAHPALRRQLPHELKHHPLAGIIKFWCRARLQSCNHRFMDSRGARQRGMRRPFVTAAPFRRHHQDGKLEQIALQMRPKPQRLPNRRPMFAQLGKAKKTIEGSGDVAFRIDQRATLPGAGTDQREQRTEPAIASWCVKYLAGLVEVPAEQVDKNGTFASLGMDSVARATFMVALEEFLNVTVTPDDIAEYPTIAALARHLAPRVSETA